jgi:hypothetical protein
VNFHHKGENPETQCSNELIPEPPFVRITTAIKPSFGFFPSFRQTILIQRRAQIRESENAGWLNLLPHLPPRAQDPAFENFKYSGQDGSSPSVAHHEESRTTKILIAVRCQRFLGSFWPTYAVKQGLGRRGIIIMSVQEGRALSCRFERFPQPADIMTRHRTWGIWVWQVTLDHLKQWPEVRRVPKTKHDSERLVNLRIKDYELSSFSWRFPQFISDEVGGKCHDAKSNLSFLSR